MPTETTSKINIIIRIEDKDDPEQSVEAKFLGCDPAAILGDEKCGWAHGIIKQYMDAFETE